MQQHVELTLIVAATRNMGIGLKGTLPWTGLKKEMAYFARVTKRLPTQASENAVNAVIMGRNTWESIPPRFRPLPGRLNVVITSRPLVLEQQHALTASSIDDAMDKLRTRGDSVGRIFVIGGASVYGAALEKIAARRILLTRVETDFECDTYFPIQLGGDGDGGDRTWQQSSKDALDGWVGETVPEGTQTEAGIDYRFELWERASQSTEGIPE